MVPGDDDGVALVPWRRHVEEAMACSSRWTTRAPISPEAIAQKMQSGSGGHGGDATHLASGLAVTGQRTWKPEARRPSFTWAIDRVP